MKLRNIILLTLTLLAFTAPSWAIGIAGSAGGKRVTVSVDGTWQGTYAAGTTYALGAIVTDGTVNYRSIQASNTGHTPASSPTYWQAVLVKGDTGPTGATGSQGPAGAPGADGRTVLTTSGAPSAGIGANGDYAYDPATYLMYGPKSGGAWPSGTLIKGADGAGFTGGTDGTYGWLTDSNTSAYSECVAGKYGLNFIGGEARMCKNGSNDLFLGLPTQTGNSGKYLTTNGTAASWGTIAAGSGIAISTDIPTETGAANLNDSTHVLTVASTTGYTQFTGSFTAWDTTPDAFSFTDETDIALSTTKTSDAITVAGINYPSAISVTGDTGYGYSKNSAACTATSGTVVAGDTVAACVTSSGSNSTATTATVTIGGVSDTYSVTTAAGSSYSDILFYWDAENTLVANKGGITGASSNTTFTTASKVGTYAIAKSSDYGNVSFATTSAQFDPVGGQMGFWYQSTGYQTGGYNYIIQANYDASNYLRLMQHSSGGIKSTWRVGGTDYIAEYTTAGLTANTWYYITYKWHPGDAGNDAVLTIYNADGSTFGSATVATITSMANPPTSLVYGHTSGDPGRPVVDHLVISNDITRDMWVINSTTGM